MKTIDENDTNVGEARQADHIIRDAGFTVDEQMEYVLVQSKTGRDRDPAFRAVVERRDHDARRLPAGRRSCARRSRRATRGRSRRTATRR